MKSGRNILPTLVLLLFAFCFNHPETYAQNGIDTAAIKARLSSIFERDQKTRTRGDSVEYMEYIDSCNTAEIVKWIDSFGWPGKGFVGANGNYTVWLVMQHADSTTQITYLPLLEQSVAKGESDPVYLAYLKDRVWMRQGKKQVYGTQVVLNKQTGAWEFWPIEEEKQVNYRRGALGLEPMEAYAKRFGIIYQAPN